MANNHRQDDSRRHSAIQNLLNMFHLSSPSTLPLNSEEDGSGEGDEPPDEPLSPLGVNAIAAHQQQSTYVKSALPAMDRKESLLTRALTTDPNANVPSRLASLPPAALSRTSTFSNASIPSTAELTSDADDTSPARSATPSPPLPSSQYEQLHTANMATLPPTSIAFATGKEHENPTAVDSQESKVEANLGRKRCITFACAGKLTGKDSPVIKEEKTKLAQPQKRKCMLTFACPARPSQTREQIPEASRLSQGNGSSGAHGSAAPSQERDNFERCRSAQSSSTSTDCNDPQTAAAISLMHRDQANSKLSAASPFHEFATRNDHEDPWVHEAIDSQRKLTLSDCMKKENAYRKIGEEAEEEAEQEEKDQDELEDENEDGNNEDDFAPSDGGNESDNEAGFGESDNEDSGAESDDQFWIPPKVAAAATAQHSSSLRPLVTKESASSIGSLSDQALRRHKTSGFINIKNSKHRRSGNVQQLRPSTPELPDSTDFVCGTFDEDRPLEAAYISCREQKKREKHIPIPQDIDPSFPTTDPEDMDEEDEEDLDGPDEHLWLKDQLEGFEDEPTRGQASKYPRKRSGLRSPLRVHSSPPKHGVHRSPPPPRLPTRRSPPAPKGRLFGRSPRRLHSPPPPMKLSSPPGTRRQSPVNMPLAVHQPQGLGISRLAQRPHMTGTSSLPRTPNPFFHNYHARTQQNDRVAFGHVTPGREMHVRGPVDIVIGLEKKRQKRKEKFWRQHCRRVAKEQAERKTIPGKGAERMRELGLECAERTRGYGLGQQPALVISL